jgi:hypothetical protein
MVVWGEKKSRIISNRLEYITHDSKFLLGNAAFMSYFRSSTVYQSHELNLRVVSGGALTL